MGVDDLRQSPELYEISRNESQTLNSSLVNDSVGSVSDENGDFNYQAGVAAVKSFMTAFNIVQDQHTEGTPERVVKAWMHRLKGYQEDPARHLETRFPVSGSPGIVIVSGITVSSTCAHHLLPITGTATVAYRPAPGTAEVVGLSKLSRVLEGYASRLQVQEELGQQTVTAIVRSLKPLGAAVVITAEHGCMTLRGVESTGSVTTTVSCGGSWSSDHPDVNFVMNEHRR